MEDIKCAVGFSFLFVSFCINNQQVSTVTCSLDLLAHIVDAAMQPVKDTEQTGNGFLAELHAALEVQGELLLTAVLQCSQKTFGVLT